MLVFESDELDRTEEFLSAHYAPMRIATSSAKAGARISRAASERVSVDHVRYDFELSYDVEPLGRLFLCDVDSGTFRRHAPDGAAPASFGPGELFVLAPPERPYEGTLDHAQYTLTSIDLSLLARLTAPGREGETLRLLDHRPVDEAAARRLRVAIRHLDEAVLSDPAALSSPLVLGAAEQYVAAQILAAFPTNIGQETARDSRDAHPATVRRAIRYIESHADEDLSPARIAAAVHVSVRTLQLAFRRHLDDTPTGYLRQVRLDGVHRDLVSAGPERTVAEIAARWGFRHQGHFGQSYRQRYGETPGATLRRT